MNSKGPSYPSFSEEVERDINLWRDNAFKVLRMAKTERVENKRLHLLIWSIIRKAGGEIRLRDHDFDPLRTDWDLVKSFDYLTMETVLRAKLTK